MMSKNDAWIQERFSLAKDRICSISHEMRREEPLFCYLYELADRFDRTISILENVKNGNYFLSLEQVSGDNAAFYLPYSELGYPSSYANPVFAKTKLPHPLYEGLSFIYREFCGMFYDAIWMKQEQLLRKMEFFLELYSFLADPSLSITRETTLLLNEMISQYLFDYAKDATIERLELIGDLKDAGAFHNAITNGKDLHLLAVTIREDEMFFYRLGVPVLEENRKHILALLLDGPLENRYAESLDWIMQDRSLSILGFRGPWYKLPFLLQSLENKTLPENILPRFYPSAFGLIESFVDDNGIYGPMADGFIRQRRNDVSHFVNGKLKARILKQVDAFYKTHGMTDTDNISVWRL